MRRPIRLLLCFAALFNGAIATQSAASLEDIVVTPDSSSLLEAVQLLISEVSDLKTDNLSLRKDVDQAQTQIVSLQQENKDLTHNLQQQSKKLASSSSSPITKSNKLRGKTDDKLPSEESLLFLARIQELEDKLSCVADDSDSNDIFFVGCNVHVRDGSGATQGLAGGAGVLQSGRGNLIVGYNEGPTAGEAPEVCSNSSAADVVGCRREGGVWGQGLQTGIHNLVVGSGHSYTRHSGIVAGRNNAITGNGANAIGGRSNVASGEMATVTGGTENTATGKSSIVVGGFDNSASGDDAVVAGGSYNVAAGSVAAVVGGENNQALGDTSFIAGGTMNEVSGEYSCATSSFATTATGKETSISGGREVFASLDETIIAGSFFGMAAASHQAAHR